MQPKSTGFTRTQQGCAQPLIKHLTLDGSFFFVMLGFWVFGSAGRFNSVYYRWRRGYNKGRWRNFGITNCCRDILTTIPKTCLFIERAVYRDGPYRHCAIFDTPPAPICFFRALPLNMTNTPRARSYTRPLSYGSGRSSGAARINSSSHVVAISNLHDESTT